MSLRDDIGAILDGRRQALERIEDQEQESVAAMTTFFRVLVRAAYNEFAEALEYNRVRTSIIVTDTSASISAFHAPGNKPAEFIYTMKKFEGTFEVVVQMTSYGCAHAHPFGSFQTEHFSKLTKSIVIQHLLDAYAKCQLV